MRILLTLFLICFIFGDLYGKVPNMPLNAVTVHFDATNSFWTNQFIEALKDELGKTKKDIRWSAFSTQVHSKEFILTQIDSIKPSFVVLETSSVNDLLMAELVKRKIPTFFSAAMKDDQIPWINNEAKHFQTGVFHREDNFVLGFKVLEEIFKITSLGILGSENSDTKKLADSAEKQLLMYKPTLKIKRFHTSKFTSWQKKLVELDKSTDALLVFLPFGVVLDDGAPVSWDLVGDLMRAVTTKPTLGLSSVDKGPIDRLVANAVSPYKLGLQTAMLIYRWLEGTPINQIKAESFRFTEIQVNRKEVERLHVKLPENIFGFATII